MDRSGHWITDKKRSEIYAQNKMQCAYCGTKCHRPRGKGRKSLTMATLDHVVPRVLGGSNAADNLVVACNRCNALKNDHSVAEFVAILAATGVDRASIGPRVRAQFVRGVALESKLGRRAGRKVSK